MILYDQKSDINWAYTGLKTVEEMKQNISLKLIFEKPTVLYEADGKVYGYDFLDDLIKQYNIDQSLPAEEKFELLKYRSQITDATTEENDQAILELSNTDDKEKSSINIISQFADGSRTAYIPNATVIGAKWTDSVALGKEIINNVPEQYKDEVIYRLENNIFN